MLKMIGAKLEKRFDIDMYLFIEKGLRRGISYITKRYRKANYKYTKDYANKKTVEILLVPWYEQFVWLDNEWLSSLWCV